MKLTTLLAAIALLTVTTSAQQVEVDPKLPAYKKSSEGVSGSVASVGSDTMNNLMTLWAEGFRKHYPAVQVEVQGKGSATAPTALLEGTANFGPMSRAMKEKEIDEFKKKFGYAPLALPTAIDMLAVYVHKDNPIRSLTLQQVDAIFSSTRLGGEARDLRTWGDLGLTGDWADKPISLYGRNSASGTYGYFKEFALFKGDFKDSVKEQPGSSAVVQGIAQDKYGIGYSGIGYLTADVRAVPLAASNADDVVEATPANAYSGDYPLSRFLYVYINKKPGAQLDPLRREFVQYMFSKEGQTDVVKDGYYPVTARIAQKALADAGVRQSGADDGVKR